MSLYLLTGSTEDVLAQTIVESDNIVVPMVMDIMDPSLEASPAHSEPIQQREPSPMEIEHEESTCQPRIPPPEAGPVLEPESPEIFLNNWYYKDLKQKMEGVYPITPLNGACTVKRIFKDLGIQKWWKKWPT